LSAAINQAVADRAERERHDQAEYWFGEPMPNWTAPARIRLERLQRSHGAVGDSGGGSTSFVRSGGEVTNFSGRWVATSQEYLLESVVPHEVSHTVWHSHWRSAKEMPPRWLDEGIATMMETESEQRRILANARGGRLDTSLAARNYSEVPNTSTLYGHGYAVCLKVFQDHGKDGLVRMADDVANRGTERGIIGLGYRSSRAFSLQFKLPIFRGLLKRGCHCRDRVGTPPAPPITEPVPVESEPRWVPGPPGPKGDTGATGGRGEQGPKGDAGQAADASRIVVLEQEVAALRKRLDNFEVERTIEVTPERRP
jgi:hypothetical protein